MINPVARHVPLRSLRYPMAFARAYQRPELEHRDDGAKDQTLGLECEKSSGALVDMLETRKDVKGGGL
jgi:hypothetical protein